MLLINNVEPNSIEFLESEGNYKKNILFDSSNSEIPNEFVNDILKDARRAAEAHRRNRQNLQQIIKPGVSLKKIVETVEDNTRILLKGEMNDGIGFPTGISLNEYAAHFTLNPGDEDIFLTEKDVLKIDFGTHSNGVIMDSAFTVAFDPTYEPLLAASKEATRVGIKNMGVDVRVCDVGAAISEVIYSYEVEINNQIFPIKPVENLNGHSIEKFTIHAGISIPPVDNKDKTKVKENTFYAIETFATTGGGYVVNGKNCSHYILNPSRKIQVKNENVKTVYEIIKKKLTTLPFCPRYIDHLMPSQNSSLVPVKMLAMLKAIDSYPPLVDIKNSFVSQFEHTIFIGEHGKEILTIGDDY
ncbi:M24 metallopeptidase [Hamiltosporidium magnivora]|uniref:Methionine aminopeptidase 2 n=1 Tax=Hamiltosporidium magnivora TaxID=148818 RepID=A0A4Q9LHG7_9MICR|nr:M24 metallopeptidase [Hamiltosporidium magnivora]